jgi:hypothetical protein
MLSNIEEVDIFRSNGWTRARELHREETRSNTVVVVGVWEHATRVGT